MILLRLVSWQYVRKHLLRSILTTAGIVLGVAVFVGMHAANQSVLHAFNDTVDRIAGRTQLQVSAGEPGFDEEVLEKVQAASTVRVAEPVIEAPVDSGLAGQGNLLILGIDMTGDRSLRDYELEGGEQEILDDPLVFLAQPDSLIITQEFAARTGLRAGSQMSLESMDGRKQFTVRGILRAGGMASAFGGNLAVMDIYAAQKMFGRGRKFDRIDLAMKEGVTLPQCQAELRNLLGPGFKVEPPSGRGQHFESLLRVYTTGVNISSLFALFIGMFIIYNSFSIAVTQRRGEIGILRALGATRGQIRALFLGESVLAGLFGSALGIAFGLVVARGLAAYTSALIESVLGVAQRPERIEVAGELLLAALAIGVVTSILAAWIPARNAARVDPVQALQKGKYQVLSAGENRLRRICAVFTAGLSLLSLLFAASDAFFYAGYLLLVLTALLLTPSLALWLSRALRFPLKWLRPVEGSLAADSLIQAPRRTSATVAALMLSLAMVIGLGGVARASYISIIEWMDTALDPDLFVATSERLVDRSYHFPISMAAALRQVQGVSEVQPVRSSRVQFRGGPVLLIALEMERVGKTSRHRRVVAGDYEEMHRLAAAGKGAILSENLTELQRLRLGDTIELGSPGGMLRLPVVGILRDYSDQLGTILIDRSLFVSRWNDDTADIFRVYLARGAAADEVKRRILERFARQRRLFVLKNDEVKRYVLRLTDQWFGMTYVQIAIAVLVAILGIVNTLTVSIADRRRELGVLRAVGGLSRQIRHTIWLEALAIGFIGLVLGIGVGALDLFYHLEIVRRDFAGLRLDYQFPVGVAMLLAPVILGAAFAAALAPAETAVRSSLVEALEYE